jgi:hypothetical protein
LIGIAPCGSKSDRPVGGIPAATDADGAYPDADPSEAPGGKEAEAGPDKPAGGFEAGNPSALRILTGHLEKKTSDGGKDFCSFDKVFLVDDKLQHTTIPVDSENDCSWKSEWPASKPMAIAGVKETQMHGITDLDQKSFQVLSPGNDVINLGLQSLNEKGQLIPEYPIPADDLLLGSGADADDDGIDDEFDHLSNALLYGFYKPGSVHSRSRGDVDVCPSGHRDGVKIELKPWSPPKDSSDEMRNVELIFRALGTDAKTPPDTKWVLRGRIDAGFISVVSPTALPYVCNGWVTQKPDDFVETLLLKISCQPARDGSGYCEYVDFEKL